MEKNNPKEGQPYETELTAIFKEHWNHARHCENERLQFTSIYAAVVAAILYFVGKTNLNEAKDTVPLLALIFFGLVLSVIGFLIVVTLSLGYEHHIADICMIFYRWDKMEFYRHPPKPIYFMDIHRMFYEITIALFAGLLLFYEFGNWASFIVSAIVFFHIEGFYQLWWKRHIRKCWKFEAALRNDAEGKYRDEWGEYFKNPREGQSTIKAEEIWKRVIDDATKRGII